MRMIASFAARRSSWILGFLFFAALSPARAQDVGTVVGIVTEEEEPRSSRPKS